MRADPSSHLSDFVLMYYFEIAAEYLAGNGKHLISLKELSRSYMSESEVESCLKSSHNAPELINCIKKNK